MDKQLRMVALSCGRNRDCITTHEIKKCVNTKIEKSLFMQLPLAITLTIFSAHLKSSTFRLKSQAVSSGVLILSGHFYMIDKY